MRPGGSGRGKAGIHGVQLIQFNHFLGVGGGVDTLPSSGKAQVEKHHTSKRVGKCKDVCVVMAWGVDGVPRRVSRRCWERMGLDVVGGLVGDV